MATVKIGTVIFDGAVPRNDIERAYELLALCEQNGLLTRHVREYEREIDGWSGATMAYERDQAMSEIVESLIEELNTLLTYDNMIVEWVDGDLIVS